MDKSIELMKAERLDDLHRNGYKIIQNTEGFCFGMDAVLLSGFAKVNKGEEVLDIGTGTGVIPILLEAKTEGKHFIGLEIQSKIANMAKRSVRYNGLSDKIEIVNGDIKNGLSIFKKSSFDVITSNPPYMKLQKGLENSNELKAISRHEISCTLEDIIDKTSKLLKVGGRFYMVHRPHRLIDIIELLRRYRLEPKKVRFVYPYVDKAPNMVLIESVRHGKPNLVMEKPLIVYKGLNEYTDEIYEIYGYEK